MQRPIEYRAYHSGQMLQVSAVDFEKHTIRVVGPVKIVRWREDEELIGGMINTHAGEGTHFSSEVNGELSLDNPRQLPVYLMEFTGLFDKHGKKIFEGDIVQCAHGNCRIDFGKWVSDNENNDDILGWIVIGEYSAHALDPQLAYWVIGNIYQNPELIQRSKHAR